VAEPIVIRTMMVIADAPGAEPIATGQVVEGSALGATPLCVGGSIVDTHASNDPKVEPLGLIDRTITCPDGALRVVFTPGGFQGHAGPGTWTIVSGTGTFAGWHGSGTVEVEYDPDDDAVGRETLSGVVSR
jgi:hypothetical protein